MKKLHLKEYIAEFIGTSVFMFVTLLSVVLAFGVGTSIDSVNLHVLLRLLFVGVVSAIGLLIVVYSSIGQRSGAHLNPAVTIGFFVLKKIHLLDAFMYIVMQILAATFAAYVILILFKDVALSIDIAITFPGENVSILIAFLTEVAITFMLMTLVVFFINHKKWSRYAGLAVGVYIVIVVVVASLISGASLNPARSIGPAYVSGIYSVLWLYIIAPVVGSLMGAIRMIYMGHGAKSLCRCAKLYHTKRHSCIFVDCGYNK